MPTANQKDISLLQAGDRSAFQQAESWVQSALAWAARLLAAFPLYRDLLQPVSLAVHEMRAGLVTLVSAQKAMQSASQDEQLGSVVAQLGAFPLRDLQQGARRAGTRQSWIMCSQMAYEAHDSKQCCCTKMQCTPCLMLWTAEL